MPKNSKPENSAGKRINGVDLQEVERVLAFMKEHGLEEFEYESNGVHIRLKKPSVAIPVAYRPGAGSEVTAAGGSHGSDAASHTSSGAPHGAPVEAGRAEDLHVIKSPIVGTFYSSASPGSDPYVSIGSHVESGQVLCIIEAMKLMNEIESDVAGEVVRIFAENGQPVEYGQPLFGIHPQRKK
ncbi:MAG TPA: acetyl-CoA carboxylase biotin carboxyl carrier protein [Candidatus Limnocylindrales bacterium]|nr:acetyl-CoA carboxylase biotin carboxyl carrier protein [Candidatus Limnocylindrales bacterium]